MSPTLPPNVHVSKHPCLQAKLSQLRSKNTSPKETKALIHEIALILGTEAFASSLVVADGPKDETPLDFEYTTTTISPHSLSLVPILRSGLGMVDAIQTLLPEPVPVRHLGLYRDAMTRAPVEYYNNFTNDREQDPASALAIILDPVIATGATCAAAIEQLDKWGVRRILVLSVIAAAEGARHAATALADSAGAGSPVQVDIWLAGLDPDLTDLGMLRPGVGDIGDRLFLTLGK